MKTTETERIVTDEQLDRLKAELGRLRGIVELAAGDDDEEKTISRAGITSLLQPIADNLADLYCELLDPEADAQV